MPSTIPMVKQKSLKTQYQVSYVLVEAMEVDPAPSTVTSPVKKNRTKSPALARSWTLFSRSAGERGIVLASQVAEAVT